MELFFECACCGVENAVLIDLDNGDNQELEQECEECSCLNIIGAVFDYHTSSYEFSVHHEAVK